MHLFQQFFPIIQEFVNRFFFLSCKSFPYNFNSPRRRNLIQISPFEPSSFFFFSFQKLIILQHTELYMEFKTVSELAISGVITKGHVSTDNISIWSPQSRKGLHVQQTRGGYDTRTLGTRQRTYFEQDNQARTCEIYAPM